MIWVSYRLILLRSFSCFLFLWWVYSCFLSLFIKMSSFRVNYYNSLVVDESEYLKKWFCYPSEIIFILTTTLLYNYQKLPIQGHVCPKGNLRVVLFPWVRLDTLNVNQIKHILTVKNPNSIAYLIKIMSFEPNSKPIDRILHGYSETKFQDKKGFYLREKYRYKSKKDDKIAMDKVLFENITVSRVNSLAFSVRKSFIQSGELKRCLLLFSDGNAFSFYDVK